LQQAAGAGGPQPPHKAALHEKRGPGGRSAGPRLPAPGPQKGASFPPASRPPPARTHARTRRCTPHTYTLGVGGPLAWGHRFPRARRAEEPEPPQGCPPKAGSGLAPAPRCHSRTPLTPVARRETEAGGERPRAAPRRAPSPGGGPPLLAGSAPQGARSPWPQRPSRQGWVPPTHR